MGERATMIDFIYVIIPLSMALLLLAVHMEEYILGLFSGFMIFICGVYVVIYGTGGTINFFSESLGVILVCLGFYIFIRGSVEEIAQAI